MESIQTRWNESVKWRIIFWVAIIAVSLRSYVMGGETMLDRLISIAGLALAFIGLITQYRWPRVPRWATDVGLAVGCILIGLAVSPLLPWHQDFTRQTPVEETKNTYSYVQMLDMRGSSVEVELSRIRDTQSILTGKYAKWVDDVIDFSRIIQSELKKKETVAVEFRAAALAADGNELLSNISELGVLLPINGMWPASYLTTISSKIVLMKDDQKQADNTIFLLQEIRNLTLSARIAQEWKLEASSALEMRRSQLSRK